MVPNQTGNPAAAEPPAFRPVARASLSDHIVAQITELISRRELKPGHRIPSEKQLCQQFGVGRTSVREALASLSAMGVLQSHMGDGTFVADDPSQIVKRTFGWSLLLNAKVVEDLAETRLMLESHTVFLAATKATDRDLEEAREAIEGMKTSLHRLDDFMRHDVRFHLTIARATQNSILESLLGATRGYLHAWMSEMLADSARPNATKRARLSVAEHDVSCKPFATVIRSGHGRS